MVLGQSEIQSWHKLTETEVTRASLYHCSQFLAFICRC